MKRQRPKVEYKFCDKTPVGDPQYIGYADINQNWYFVKVTSAGARYTKGHGDYIANWANRENLTYYYIFELSWM